MGDDHQRDPALEALEGAADGLLRRQVEGAGRLVEHQQRRSTGEGPGDAQALALAAREPAPSGSDPRVETLGPRLDLVEHVGGPGRLDHPVRADPVAEADDVVEHGPVEQVRILGHQGHHRRPARTGVLLGCVAVDQHPPLVGLPEAEQQLHDGRLPGSRGPDDADGLARADLEVDVVERGLPGVVGEAHLVEPDGPQRLVERERPHGAGRGPVARELLVELVDVGHAGEHALVVALQGAPVLHGPVEQQHHGDVGLRVVDAGRDQRDQPADGGEVDEVVVDRVEPERRGLRLVHRGREAVDVGTDLLLDPVTGVEHPDLSGQVDELVDAGRHARAVAPHAARRLVRGVQQRAHQQGHAGEHHDHDHGGVSRDGGAGDHHDDQTRQGHDGLDRRLQGVAGLDDDVDEGGLQATGLLDRLQVPRRREEPVEHLPAGGPVVGRVGAGPQLEEHELDHRPHQHGGDGDDAEARARHAQVDADDLLAQLLAAVGQQRRQGGDEHHDAGLEQRAHDPEGAEHHEPTPVGVEVAPQGHDHRAGADGRPIGLHHAQRPATSWLIIRPSGRRQGERATLPERLPVPGSPPLRSERIERDRRRRPRSPRPRGRDQPARRLRLRERPPARGPGRSARRSGCLRPGAPSRRPPR